MCLLIILFKNEIRRVNDERTKLITDVLKNWSINATALETTFAGYISNYYDFIFGLSKFTHVSSIKIKGRMYHNKKKT